MLLHAPYSKRGGQWAGGLTNIVKKRIYLRNDNNLKIKTNMYSKTNHCICISVVSAKE
jgi:hypothetical protein